jgi:hypothetical protein
MYYTRALGASRAISNKFLEPMSGLEPLTFALRKHCSTN